MRKKNKLQPSTTMSGLNFSFSDPFSSSFSSLFSSSSSSPSTAAAAPSLSFGTSSSSPSSTSPVPSFRFGTNASSSASSTKSVPSFSLFSSSASAASSSGTSTSSTSSSASFVSTMFSSNSSSPTPFSAFSTSAFSFGSGSAFPKRSASSAPFTTTTTSAATSSSTSGPPSSSPSQSSASNAAASTATAFSVTSLTPSISTTATATTNTTLSSLFSSQASAVPTPSIPAFGTPTSSTTTGSVSAAKSTVSASTTTSISFPRATTPALSTASQLQSITPAPSFGVNADMLTAGKRKNKRAADTGQKALTHNGAFPEDVPLVAMGQQQVLETPAGDKKCIENALEEGEKRKMPVVLDNPSPTKKSKGGDKGKEVAAAEEREHPNFGRFWGVHNKNDKPTWLNRSFKMPEDVKHLMELADELADVPPLNNILVADLSPQARELVGQGLLKRVTFPDGCHISESFPSALAGRLGYALAEIATCGHLLFDQARHVAEADVEVERLIKINKYLDDQRKKLDADLTAKVGECSNLELEVKKWKSYYHNASQEALQTTAKVKDLGLQLKATKTGISHLTKEQKAEICLEFQQSKEYKEALTYEAMTLYQQGQQHVFRMMAAAGIYVDIEERVRWVKTKHYDEEARKGASIVPYATEEYLHLKGWVPPPAVPNNIMDRVYWVEEEEDDGSTQVEREATQADANAAAVGGADANAAPVGGTNGDGPIGLDAPLGNHSSVAAYELPPKQNA